MITHKVCKSCGKNLEISNFTKSKQVKDGYENKCKVCRRKQRPTYSKNCEVCKKEFTTQTKETRFCSKECQGIARRDRIETKCSYCLKDIEVVKSLYERNTYNYCNQGCRTEHLKVLMAGENNPNYDRVKYNCDGCGKEIDVIPSRIKEQKYIFCSNECYKKNIGKFCSGENNSNYRKIIKECINCGKEMKRKPSEFRYDNQFCSRKCANQYSGKLREDKKVVNCDYCGEEIERAKSQFNGKHSVYCSRECQHKGFSILYSGENSHAYNHDKPLEERLIERKYVGYYEWRKEVYERDDYTCQCCGDNKGSNLVAHHLLNYSEHEELRTDVDNGITLCKTCHKEFHDTYGYKNNNKEQLKEFIYNKAS